MSSVTIDAHLDRSLPPVSGDALIHLTKPRGDGPEKIDVAVAASCQAQPRLGVDRLQTHQTHQPLHALAVDVLLLLFAQPGRHPPAAVERMLRVLPVDQTHQPQVVGRLSRRLIIQG